MSAPKPTMAKIRRRQVVVYRLKTRGMSILAGPLAMAAFGSLTVEDLPPFAAMVGIVAGWFLVGCVISDIEIHKIGTELTPDMDSGIWPLDADLPEPEPETIEPPKMSPTVPESGSVSLGSTVLVILGIAASIFIYVLLSKPGHQ